MNTATCPTCGQQAPITVERTLIDKVAYDVTYIVQHSFTLGAVRCECKPHVVDKVEVTP